MIRIRVALLLAFLTIVAVNGGTYALVKVSENRITPDTLFDDEWRKLSNIRRFTAVRWLRDNAARDAVVLAMRPSDMYYSGRRMMSYLDPALLGFYGTRDARSSLGLLRGLGIEYVYVPNYGLPMVYNSALAAILGDPSLARLETAADGFSLYRLGRFERSESLARAETRGIFTDAEGLKAIARRCAIYWVEPAARCGTWRDPDGRAGAWIKSDYGPAFWMPPQVFMHGGEGGDDMPPSLASKPERIKGGATYRLTARTSGRGMFNVVLLEYSPEWGEAVMQVSHPFRTILPGILGLPPDHFTFARGETPLWTSLLSAETATIATQFRTLPGTAEYRLAVRLSGPAELRISDVELQPVEPDEPEPAPPWVEVGQWLPAVPVTGRLEIGAEQKDSRDVWLFSPRRTVPAGDRKVRMTGLVSGDGTAEVVFVASDARGREVAPKITLATLALGNEPREFAASGLLPADASSLSIGIRLTNVSDRSRLARIRVENFSVSTSP